MKRKITSKLYEWKNMLNGRMPLLALVLSGILYGVQFHPEAVLTEYGHELLENFCKIAEGRDENKYVS